MSVSHTPGLILQKSGQAVGTQLTRVFLRQDGTDAATGGPMLVLDDAGPATHVFTHDSVNGLILIDSNPAAPAFPALKAVLDENGVLIFYT